MVLLFRVVFSLGRKALRISSSSTSHYKFKHQHFVTHRHPCPCNTLSTIQASTLRHTQALLPLQCGFSWHDSGSSESSQAHLIECLAWIKHTKAKIAAIIAMAAAVQGTL